MRWCGCPRPARRSICTAAAHQRRAPPLRKYSQLDARQTAGSSQLAISVQILCKLQRPRHGGGQRAVWDNSYLRTSHTYHHNHIMVITCYHAQLCGSTVCVLQSGYTASFVSLAGLHCWDRLQPCGREMECCLSRLLGRGGADSRYCVETV